MIAINAFKGREGEHFAIIENLVPDFGRALRVARKSGILDQQDSLASRAHIVQGIDAERIATSQAAINQLARRLGDKIGLYKRRELVALHGVSFSMPSI